MYRIIVRGLRFAAAAAVLLAGLTLLPLGIDAPASAAGRDPVPLAVYDLPTVINNLRNWIVGILLAVATLFLTIGGTRYMMASDPSELERAKGNMRSAGIGYAFAVMAPVLMAIVRGILGVE